MSTLIDMHCQHRTGPSLSDADTARWLAEVSGWERPAGRACIEREFRFGDYYETMAFVNAVAWIAHREDHHPDMEIGYNRCHIRFLTHTVGGLSLNDFICAAKINALFMPTD